MGPQPQVERGKPNSDIAKQSNQTPSLHYFVQVPSAPARAVMDAETGKMQCCPGLIAQQREKPTQNPKLGTYFISFPVAAQS